MPFIQAVEAVFEISQVFNNPTVEFVSAQLETMEYYNNRVRGSEVPKCKEWAQMLTKFSKELI